MGQDKKSSLNISLTMMRIDKLRAEKSRAGGQNEASKRLTLELEIQRLWRRILDLNDQH